MDFNEMSLLKVVKVFSFCGKIPHMEKLKHRFQQFSVADWVTFAFMTLVMAFGLYMSISMSVKLAQGITLFGDSSVYDNTAIERDGPTGADISVLVLYWVLSVAMIALFVYFTFFKKVGEEKKVTQKRIEDGRTVIIKEKENDHN
jgi:hypothetical protein